MKDHIFPPLRRARPCISTALTKRMNVLSVRLDLSYVGSKMVAGGEMGGRVGWESWVGEMSGRDEWESRR
jgi:hypothetical protein